MEDNGYIYLVTNTINGKKYVGQTRTSIDRRIKSHINQSNRYKNGKVKCASIFHKAIAKYGWENFVVQMLQECPIQQLNDNECYWIEKLSTTNRSIGYNVSPGGGKSTGHSEETKKLIAQCNSGKVWVTNGVDNRFCTQSDANTIVSSGDGWAFGKSIDKSFYKSIDRSNKISQSTKGLVCVTNGITMTKIRPDQLQQYESAGFRLGTIFNGQVIYRLWVTNGKVEKTIQEKELQSYINKCYVQGRLSDFSNQQLKDIAYNYDNHVRQQHLNNARVAQNHNRGRQRTQDQRDSLSNAMKEFYKTEEGKMAIKSMQQKKQGAPNKTKGIKRGASATFLEAMEKQRGKIYVTNGFVDKLISIDELDYMLQNGYVRGRRSKKKVVEEVSIDGYI